MSRGSLTFIPPSSLALPPTYPRITPFTLVQKSWARFRRALRPELLVLLLVLQSEK